MSWKKNYKDWINNEYISNEDKNIIKNMKEEEKKENFSSQLEFGTAGIRGIRGLGTNRINFYIIRKITQGYCNYISKINKNIIKKSIAIAYDTRYLSKEFADEAAKVFSGNDFSVYLFSIAKSTPELSFAIRKLKTCGGVVLTASHNSAEYSGYKVYDSIGAQLKTLETKKLTKEINKINNFSKIKLNEKVKNIKNISKKLDYEYLEEIKKNCLNKFNKDLIIAYSPLHGVGLSPIVSLFDSVKAKYTLVKEQCIQDINFKTIPKPNPEERKSFDFLIKYGLKKNAELLLATDPDADRLGVMSKYKNKYIYLTGNQIGGLLIDYILTYKKYNVENSYILTSVVTSKFGAEIAKKYGIKTEVTLTGFKNLGHKIEELKKSGKNILFSYEESIGYLPNTFTRDKDGISSAFLVSEMAGVLKKEGKTLVDQLAILYKRNGYYKETQLSYEMGGRKGIERIKNIMSYFREKELKGLPNIFIIKNSIDYLIKNIDGENSDLLCYNFNDRSWIAIRPSGTEPKLKIYINIVAESDMFAKKKCNLLKRYFATHDIFKKYF